MFFNFIRLPGLNSVFSAISIVSPTLTFDKSLRLQFQEETLLNKSKAQMGLNHWKESIENLDKLLKKNPEKAEAWWLESQCLRKIHEITKSKQCLKKAEELREKPRSLLEDGELK